MLFVIYCGESMKVTGYSHNKVKINELIDGVNQAYYMDSVDKVEKKKSQEECIPMKEFIMFEDGEKLDDNEIIDLEEKDDDRFIYMFEKKEFKLPHDIARVEAITKSKSKSLPTPISKESISTLPSTKPDIDSIPIEEIIMKVTDAKEKPQVYQILKTKRPRELQIQITNLINGESQHTLEAIRAILRSNMRSGDGTYFIRRSSGSTGVQPDPQLVENLREMGFEEERVKRVLISCNNNLNLATDILINDTDYYYGNGTENVPGELPLYFVEEDVESGSSYLGQEQENEVVQNGENNEMEDEIEEVEEGENDIVNYGSDSAYMDFNNNYSYSNGAYSTENNNNSDSNGNNLGEVNNENNNINTVDKSGSNSERNINNNNQ